MAQIVGFIIGIILFLILITLFFSKFIFNIYFLITLICFIFLYLFILILSNYMNKKNIKKNQKELSDTLNKYIKIRLKEKLDKVKDIVIVENSSFGNLVPGENLVYRQKENLCFFPNYPTIENYLLYDDLKIIKIPIKSIISMKIIGNYEKGTDFFSKMISDKTNISLNSRDNRRTLLVYDDTKENELFLDFYAYDKINKLIK